MSVGGAQADDANAVEELLKKRSLSTKGSAAQLLKRLQTAIMEEEELQAGERIENQKWVELCDDLLASQKFVRATEETVDVSRVDGLHTAVLGRGIGRIIQAKKAKGRSVQLQVVFEEGGMQNLTLEPTATARGMRLTAHSSQLTAHGSRLTAHGLRL